MPVCKGPRCGKEIVWAESSTTGNPFPLEEDPSGFFAVVRGKAKRYTEQDAKLLRPRYKGHHASCPDAEQFRR